jgi:hypothetical protein
MEYIHLDYELTPLGDYKRNSGGDFLTVPHPVSNFSRGTLVLFRSE